MHTITIQRRHILHGKRQNCEHCPAALAVTDYFKARLTVVDIDNIQADRRVWPTPRRLGSWILAFDAHRGNRSKIPTITFRLK